MNLNGPNEDDKFDDFFSRFDFMNYPDGMGDFREK